MRYRIFSYPLPCDEEPVELNQFLASHRVTSVRKSIVRQSSEPLLIFIVEYVLSESTPSTSSARSSKIDYRETLTPDQFALFSRLRDLRKQTADLEKVPVYTVFTNAQLAEIVERNVQTLEQLRQVSGLGDSRIEKYGERLLAVLVRTDNQPVITQK